MKKLFGSLVGMFLGFSAVLPKIALAVETQVELIPQESGGQQSPFFQVANNTGINVARVISFAISAILMVAALLFFFMLVMGGIRWITSGGEKGNVEGARKQITNALIGLAIIFVAWAIIRLLHSIFGVDILQFMVPTLTTL